MYVCTHMHACIHVCLYVWAETQSTASSVVPQALPIFSETGSLLTGLISRQIVSQGLPISAFLAMELQASTTTPRPCITYLKNILIFIYYFNLFFFYQLFFLVIFFIY